MKIKQLQFKKVFGEDNSSFWYEATVPFGKYLIDQNAVWFWTSVESEEKLSRRETDFDLEWSFSRSKQICQNHFEDMVNKCLEN